jgi:hypothetical protein
MQAIKGIIAASALMFALMVVPNSATAMSSATGPEPWGEFLFDVAGADAVGCAPDNCTPSIAGNSFPLDEPPWIFSGAGVLIVQDAFFRGDQFEVFDNNVSLGLTSDPDLIDDPDFGPGCGSDPVVCFSDPNSSRRIFVLDDTAHSFTIRVAASPFGGGAAYFCINTSENDCGVIAAVPEPASMFLLGFALIGAWCWSRRKQLSKCYVVFLHKRRRR